MAVRTVGLVPAVGQAYTPEGPEFGNQLTTDKVNDDLSVSTGETGHFQSELTAKGDAIKEEPGKVLKIQTVYDKLTLPSYGVVDLIPENGISIVTGKQQHMFLYKSSLCIHCHELFGISIKLLW
jgi:hypothetical protein